MLTELHFYGMFANICRAYPPAYDYDGGPLMPCSRPNTFAALQRLSELDDPTLGKGPGYQDKPYVFFRKYEDAGYNTKDMVADYPILAATPVSMAQGPDAESSMTLSIALLDQKVYPATCPSDACLNRTEEQQIQDLHRMWSLIYKQADYFTVYRHTSTGVFYLFTPEMLTASGISASVLEDMGQANNYITQNNEFTYIKNAYSDNVCGLFGRISVSLHYCEAYVQFDYSRARVLVLDETCASC